MKFGVLLWCKKGLKYLIYYIYWDFIYFILYVYDLWIFKFEYEFIKKIVKFVGRGGGLNNVVEFIILLFYLFEERIYFMV